MNMRQQYRELLLLRAKVADAELRDAERRLLVLDMNREFRR